MTAMKLIARLVQQEARTATKLDRSQEAATGTVRLLLNELPLAEAPVCEASVHRPTRSRVWVATFTGPAGGQMWRSTGLIDRDQALLLAKHWESEARAQRVLAGRTAAKPRLRVGRRDAGTGEPLTQREVALVLKVSERAVRLVERRAIQKLFNHPSLRQVWRKYLAGELDENQWSLSPEEIDALFKLAHTAREWLLIRKLTRLIQG